jgi:hypothetical protein
MSKFVFRTDRRRRPVSEPLQGIDASEIVYRPEASTVEECVHKLLAADEICLGASEHRDIMRGARVIGHIRIVDESQQAALAA